MKNAKPLIAALLVAAAAAPAVSQDRWNWRYDDPAARGYDLEGPGVRLLYPELRDSRRGRAFVVNNFDREHDGFITPREAIAANRAFDEVAGPDRGRFDWDRHTRYVAVPVAVGRPDGPPPRGDWDRAGMRAYHFRQGREGAVFDLQDVLFRTGSAELRPGAEAQLRPLAGYLRANPDVRVAIDGHTDSVGSAEANLQLSRDRAASVASALEAMGANSGRFRLAGHGEDQPRATNATPQGRQLNRRVEVTLLGQRASAFG